MDYERIEKPQIGGGGGFSPKKLRSMLLGIDKKRKDEDEHNQSQISHSYDQSGGSGSGSDNCKDVDVVSELPECSTSDSMPGGAGEHRIRIRSQDDSSLDYDSGHDSTSVSLSSMFDFQKADRAPQRVPLGPFSKPAPSKWDDAQKWIASPNANKPKIGQGLVSVGPPGVGARKVGYLARQSSAKVVLEVPDQRIEEPDTKRIDTSQAKKEIGMHKFVNWEMEPYPPDSYGKPVLMIENSIAETAINLSCHDSSATIRTATTFMPPPSTARSVSMRDMGTEMTPIASQEPSRTGTPVRATSSPNSSPTRTAPVSSPIVSHADLNKDLSEKELQIKTRREIMALGTQLGKMNIAAWASKEEEDKDASTSLKNVATDQPNKNVVEARAASWEAAEKAKYMARFKREEMKIQAWENHQKAKTEAEMRKIEVEVERMRGRAQDKLMNKLAAARHKAEEKRASAEAKRNRQAAKTEQQADYIRRTGRIPSSFSRFRFSFCGWCK